MSESEFFVPKRASATTLTGYGDEDHSPKTPQGINDQRFPPTVITMCGLPARGKSYIARRLYNYLHWLGLSVKIFNVGVHRRDTSGTHEADFFDPCNPKNVAIRNRFADEVVDQMADWLNAGGQVGIYDATNTTKIRRASFVKQLTERGIKLQRIVFIESICNDEKVIQTNVLETKLTSPDYIGKAPEVAVSDFLKRIAYYEKAYEPMDEDHLSYVKLIDVGQHIVMNRIKGYLPGKLMNMLLNLHIAPRTIYITRHGESEYNVAGRIGGDTGLSARGQEYSRALASFIEERFPSTAPLTVWTSTLVRSIETAAHLKRPVVSWKALDEIDSGICDGMTYEEIAEQMPAEFEARKRDKLRYRYPRGESYEDMIMRLEPVIIELERQRTPILVITHQAVTRALIAYLTERSPQDCPEMVVPLHTVIEITPKAYGVQERRFPLAPDCRSSGADPK